MMSAYKYNQLTYLISLIKAYNIRHLNDGSLSLSLWTNQFYGMFILFLGFWTLLMSQWQRNIKPIKLIASYQMLHHSTNNWPWGYIPTNETDDSLITSLYFTSVFSCIPNKTLALLSSLFLVLANMSNPNKHPNVTEERNLTSKSGPSNHHQVAPFSPGEPSQWLFRLASWRLATNLWDAMEGSTFYTKNHGTYGGWKLGQQKRSFRCYVLGCPPFPSGKWRFIYWNPGQGDNPSYVSFKHKWWFVVFFSLWSHGYRLFLCFSGMVMAFVRFLSFCLKIREIKRPCVNVRWTNANKKKSSLEGAIDVYERFYCCYSLW